MVAFVLIKTIKKIILTLQENDNQAAQLSICSLLL